MKTAYPFMLGSLLTLFSCFSKSGQTPIFPQTDNATVKVKALTIPDSQNVISYIISPNKQQLLVATFENSDTLTHHPGVSSHLLVFEQNGTLEKDVPLNLDLNGALPKMYFADNGLLIMDDAVSITFINTQNFEIKSWKTYSVMSNPRRDEIQKQAKDGNQSQLYEQYVESLIQTSSNLNGLMTNDYKYIMTRDGANEGLFRIENEPSQKVNWIKTQRNSLINIKDTPHILNWENGKVQDAENTMTVLEKIETSSVKDAFTGKLAYDFVMKLAIGSKTATFKLKDRNANIGNDGFFSLKNGTAVIMHKNQVYLIH